MASSLPRPDDRTNGLTWALVAVAGLALCGLVALSPGKPLYDEQWFLDTLDLLQRDGLSVRFLREFPGAAGPTFTFIFAAIDHAWGLSFPWLRFVHVALLAASALMVWRILNATARLPASSPGPALVAAGMTMLPTVGVSAGVVLTEMPAATLAIGAVLLLAWAKAPDAKAAHSWIAILAAGLVLATAVLGRQNFLVLLPCLLLASREPFHFRRQEMFQIGVVVAIVAVVCGPVFIVWGGLIPPLSAWNGDGFSPANGIRSAGYAGLMTFLFAPEIFRPLLQRKLLLGAALLLSVPIALMTGPAPLPLASVMRAVSAEAVGGRLAAGFGLVLAFSAICFVGCFASYIWQERMNWLTRFAGGTALIGILSNAKITHQFSSRYVFVFLPFIVLAAAPAVRTSWHQPLRLALGACISLAALASYYFGQ